MTQIAKPVGKGVNTPPRDHDVKVVQQLLNKHKAPTASPISEDGTIDAKTIAAIEEFQRRVVRMSNPDGRIDLGGTTWKHLTTAPGGSSLTQLQSGSGYYSYEPNNRQFGTTQTIKAIQEVASTFSFNKQPQIGIGDISFANGGTMPPHHSHQHGTSVDIRPFRKDRSHAPITITDAQYDRETTRLLVQSLLAHRNVKSILFNDTQISGVQSYPGHHNHLHVNMES